VFEEILLGGAGTKKKIYQAPVEEAAALAVAAGQAPASSAPSPWEGAPHL